MRSVLNRTVFIALMSVALSFPLTGCLPGKEKEKEVISKAKEATETVQAEKIAADMANAAQKLLAAGATGVPTDSTEMKTVKCGTDKVLAYIPASSKLAKSGTMPNLLAQRMRTQLEGQTKPENVVRADAGIVAGCGVTTSMVAVNSPVLVLDNTMAAMAEEKTDTSGVVAVNMEKCPGGQPGVVVTKTFRSGMKSTESHCGAAAPAASALPDISLTSGAMPNWKNQILGGGPATENFSCFTSAAGCTPVAKAAPGTKIICDDKSTFEEFVANPEFDKAKYEFVPGGGDKDCGRGWKGELIARLKKKQCKVVRDGVTTTPTSVYDVAYIGATCKKDDVLIEDACPAGSPMPDGKMVSSKDVSMIAPISLVPKPTGKKGENVSTLAFKNGTKSNMDSETEALISRSISGGTEVQRPGGAKAAFELFYSRTDLGTPDPDMAAAGVSDEFMFDNRFTKEITSGKSGKKANATPVLCFGAAQTCKTGVMPEMIASVVDRSGSMLAGKFPIMKKQTSCRATMANLFKKEQRFDACKAAKEWQTLVNSTERQTQLDTWRTSTPGDPIYYFSGRAYNELMSKSSDPAKSKELEDKMRAAMFNEDYMPRLKYGLVIGQDCYPSVVRDNTYGQCAPVFATDDQVRASDYKNFPLRSCQSTCPGECITDEVNRMVNFKSDPEKGKIYPTSADPVKVSEGNRMQTVDAFTESNLLPNLNSGVKFFYTEFYNSKPDDGKTLATTPVSAMLADPATTTSASGKYTSTQTSYWINQLRQKIAAKFAARGSGSKADGFTPLYTTMDKGIDALRSEVLDNTINPHYGKDAPAVLVVMTDGMANPDNSSYYFGRNICEPEPEVDYYQCVREVSCGWFGSDKCREWKAIDINSVKSLYKIDVPGTRKDWCHFMGYDDYDGPVYKKGSTKVEQRDSLVGFFGRNYPNTKVFYLDILDGGGTDITKKCKGESKTTYTTPDGKIHQILNIFHLTAGAAAEVYKAFNSVTGSGGVPAEVAQEMCEAAYGKGIDVNTTDIPPGSPLPPLNVNTTLVPSCEGSTYLNVDDPDAVPPKTIPDPVVGGDPNDPFNGGSGSCSGGFDRYTMETCTGP